MPARGDASPGMKRAWRAVALVAAACTPVLIAFGAEPRRASARPPTEQEVKAAFVFHFAQLVDWPAPPASGPFLVGVLEGDALGPVLDEVLAGKAVRGRPIKVARYRDTEALRAAPPQVLVLAAPGPDEAALAALEQMPVLTVGEGERFAERGGMIGFRLTPEGRVAFDINLRKAEARGLRLSSQLLKLARIVGPRP